MMRDRGHRPILIVAVASCALLASGCGEEAVQTPAPQTAGAGSGNGTLVGGGGEVVTSTGEQEAAADLKVPDLAGGDLAGGFTSGSSFGIFTPKATVASTDTTASSDTTTDQTDSSFTTTTTAATYTGASIYVNGIVHSVTKNGTFPSGSPVFRLMSVSANDIEIELIAGEFTASSGTGTFLDKGDLVTLYNASEKVSYKIKYLRPIEGASSDAF